MNSKPLFILLLTFVTFTACHTLSKTESSTKNTSINTTYVETEAAPNKSSAAIDSTDTSESLNDIRFKDFKTNKDWLQNDYIVALCKHLDAFIAGEVDIPELEPYRQLTEGKIGIIQTEPFLLGGLFIYFFFLEDPNILFNADVYSDVNEDTRTVSGHRVMNIYKNDNTTGYTKEEILKMIKTNPEAKLW